MWPKIFLNTIAFSIVLGCANSEFSGGASKGKPEAESRDAVVEKEQKSSGVTKDPDDDIENKVSSDPENKSKDTSVEDIKKDPKKYKTHLLFVSSSKIAGNRISSGNKDQVKEKANSICTQLAKNAGLIGNYKALLTTVDAPTNEVNFEFKVKNLAGQVVAENGGELWKSGATLPIKYDEKAAPVAAAAKVWTGSDNTGGVGIGFGTCVHWTSNLWGYTGSPHANGGGWISSGKDDCSNENHLYCLSEK